jgi:hypothetical protein
MNTGTGMSSICSPLSFGDLPDLMHIMCMLQAAGSMREAL